MKKSDVTKQRLLEAATAEFATYGIAGGRVDRIAENAKCNKQAIYAYFESKDRLFDAVYNRMVEEFIGSVPIDANDLAAYAAGLFDRYRARPEVLRLSRWHSLERDTLPPQAALDATAEKIIAIRAAQKAGVVSERYKAEDLLELILSMSKIGAEAPPETGNVSVSADRLRKTLIDAVKRIVVP